MLKDTSVKTVKTMLSILGPKNARSGTRMLRERTAVRNLNKKRSSVSPSLFLSSFSYPSHSRSIDKKILTEISFRGNEAKSIEGIAHPVKPQSQKEWLHLRSKLLGLEEPNENDPQKPLVPFSERNPLQEDHPSEETQWHSSDPIA